MTEIEEKLHKKFVTLTSPNNNGDEISIDDLHFTVIGVSKYYITVKLHSLTDEYSTFNNKVVVFNNTDKWEVKLEG